MKDGEEGGRYSISANFPSGFCCTRLAVPLTMMSLLDFFLFSVVAVGSVVAVVAALQSIFSIVSTRDSVSSALRTTSVEDADADAGLRKLKVGLGVTKADTVTVTVCNRESSSSSNNDTVDADVDADASFIFLSKICAGDGNNYNRYGLRAYDSGKLSNKCGRTVLT